MNDEIRREALFYEGVNVEILSADDDSDKQIGDIEYFINGKVDLLIVAPNESEAITATVEKAYSEGIKVLVVDRKISSDRYTAYIGADNYNIGREAGIYVAQKYKGNVLEITGSLSSSPAVERMNGFRDGLGNAGGVMLLDAVDAEWSEQRAAEITDSVLRSSTKIDVIFAHNDRMAAAAHRQAEETGAEGIDFIGIDAISGENNGIELVNRGILDASFIYPTGGDKVMQIAMDILEGRPYEKENILSTACVDASNSRIMKMQEANIKELDKKIFILKDKIDEFLSRTQLQKMLLFAGFIIVILLTVLLFVSTAAIQSKNKANEKLKKVNALLEEATAAKIAFFTNISHDFRTPLTLIADPVNRLMQRDDLDEQERSLLNIVNKNVTVLLRLVNQILDFRKFESGKLSLELSRFRIDREISDWMEAFKSLSYLKHIDYSLSVDKDAEDYKMTGDLRKLERITYNLLSNAFKFTPENGKIKVSLAKAESAEGPAVKIIVEDNGIGISEEHIQNIFDNFYQAGVHHSGSGIGLAMVRTFVEMHKGSIGVESGKGKGCRFTVTLPVNQEGEINEMEETSGAAGYFREGSIFDAGQETIYSSGNLGVEISDNKKTVLVIDDNKDVRDYIKSILSIEFNTIEASDGKEGLRYARKYVPDAIICDVMMPIMDGLECCRILKSEMQTSHIPVMMITACAAEEQKIKGYECGADSYISKPFSFNLLLARLRNLIQNQEQLKDIYGDISLPKTESAHIDKDFIDRLREIVESRLGDPELSVEEIGRELGLGRVQLYRKTKALTGYSPNELIRISRLKRAESILLTSDKTIAEVAYSVGYSTPSYFTKCYKEYFGKMPGDTVRDR